MSIATGASTEPVADRMFFENVRLACFGGAGLCIIGAAGTGAYTTLAAIREVALGQETSPLTIIGGGLSYNLLGYGLILSAFGVAAGRRARAAISRATPG